MFSERKKTEKIQEHIVQAVDTFMEWFDAHQKELGQGILRDEEEMLKERQGVFRRKLEEFIKQETKGRKKKEDEYVFIGVLLIQQSIFSALAPHDPLLGMYMSTIRSCIEHHWPIWSIGSKRSWRSS